MGFLLFALFHCGEPDDGYRVSVDFQGAAADEASGDEDLVEDEVLAVVVVGAVISIVRRTQRPHEVDCARFAMLVDAA